MTLVQEAFSLNGLEKLFSLNAYRKGLPEVGVGGGGASVESLRVSQVPVTPGEPPQDHGQEEYSDIGVLLRTMVLQELEKKLGRDNLRRQIGILFNAKDDYPSSLGGSPHNLT
ncbi:hypothetical protein EDC04DRAFT_2608448 [Pisolithus marmoratus]|nr:hypothetical protein EDC04DRAFT_2608448 [Pisolithus marmoratus]